MTTISFTKFELELLDRYLGTGESPMAEANKAVLNNAVTKIRRKVHTDYKCY
jgi:hypothetical protein